MCSREFAQRNLVMESFHVQQGVCTEKHSHGKFPCAAENLHRDTLKWKVPKRSKDFAQRNLVMEIPMFSRDFAQRNLVMESTHVQQRLCTEKPNHGKYPCAAEILLRET